MERSAALFPIALAVAGVILAPWGAVRAEGATEIEKCQTISQPGSYKLVNNLTFRSTTGGTCLLITADFVTIDLAGFTITGPQIPVPPVLNPQNDGDSGAVVG